MDNDNEMVLDIFQDQFRIYPDANIVVFRDYKARLLNLFSTCMFIDSYRTIGSNLIIYNYNKQVFKTPRSFYDYVKRKTIPEKINAFSYNYLIDEHTDGKEIEKYSVVHKNIYAEFIIYYNDSINEQEINSIEFNYNGNFIQVYKTMALNLNSMSSIYNFITYYIDSDMFECYDR